MKNRVLKFLATGCYSGLAPLAPGTVGTIAAMILAFIWLQSFSINLYLVVGLVIAGTIISDQAAELYEIKDAPEIVIDEWAGYFVAIWGLGIQMLVPAFILFRIFDILKPPPIKNLQKLQGGLGIMVDDVVAGVITNLILKLLF
ncbi:MAG: phosphatidylglycerophosphatase A family protein [Bacillota bacterium]